MMTGRQDSYLAEGGAVVGFPDGENDPPEDESNAVAETLALMRENSHEMGLS